MLTNKAPHGRGRIVGKQAAGVSTPTKMVKPGLDDTPPKVENGHQPPAEVIGKVLISSIDVEKAMAFKQFLPRLPNSTQKTVMEDHNETLSKVANALVDFGKLPTTARWQKGLFHADKWLQWAVSGYAHEDLESYRAEAKLFKAALY